MQFTKALSSLKALGTVCAVGAISLASFGAAQAADKPHYIVGTEAGYAPFEFLSDKGEIIGFDVDLLNYVCDKIGATCELKNQSFDSLVPDLRFNKIDLAIADLQVNDERKKIITFSEQYLPGTHFLFLTKKDSPITAIDEIKSAGYQSGILAVKYLQQKTPHIKPVPYDSYDLALLGVAAGRIDAIFANAEVIIDFLKDPNYKVVGGKVTDPLLGEGPAIGIAKKHAKLKPALDAAIKEAKDSGFIDALIKKWKLDQGQEPVPATVGEAVKDAAAQAVDAAKDVAKDADEAVKDASKDAVDAVKNVVKPAVEPAKPAEVKPN